MIVATGASGASPSAVIETVRRTSRKRQALAERRHVPALDRRRDALGRARFSRVIGYPKLPALAVAVERHIARQTITDTSAPEVAATAV